MGNRVPTELTAMAQLSPSELTLLVELGGDSYPTTDHDGVGINIATVFYFLFFSCELILLHSLDYNRAAKIMAQFPSQA